MFRLRGGDAIERFGPAECCRPYSQREERVRGSVSAELSVTRDRAMNSPAFPPAAWGIQEVKHLRDPADDKRSRGRGEPHPFTTGSRPQGGANQRGIPASPALWAKATASQAASAGLKESVHLEADLSGPRSPRRASSPLNKKGRAARKT